MCIVSNTERYFYTLVLESFMQELIRLCKAGNSRGQKELFNTFHARMFRICFRYIPEQGTAEDVMINGFAKIFQGILKIEYRSDREFIAWMKRIMVNECLMEIRSRRILFSLDEVGSDLVSNHANVEVNLAAEDLYSMLLKLPDGYRTVFNLYAVEGYSHSEIAEQLAISEGTSKSQLSKARKFLQDLLIKEGGAYAR